MPWPSLHTQTVLNTTILWFWQGPQALPKSLDGRGPPAHQSGALRQGATVSPLHHSLEAGVPFLYLVNWPWHKIPKLCYRPCWARGNSSSAPSQEQYLSRTWQIAWELPRWLAESHKEGTSPRHPHPARLFLPFHTTPNIRRQKDSPCEDSPASLCSVLLSGQTPKSTTSKTHRGFSGIA